MAATGVGGVEALPVTERSNLYTQDLDIQCPHKLVDSLCSVDSQMFTGYDGMESVHSSGFQQRLDLAIDAVAELLRERTAKSGDLTYKGAVLMGGCGTSGRLAMMACTKFNLAAARSGAVGNSPPFRCLLAGGDRALLAAQEQAEDNPTRGIAEMEALDADLTDAVYIGITCGLSAPYVAGQLYRSMKDSRYRAVVLIGFNPVELARTSRLDTINMSFRDVAEAMSARSSTHPMCIMLNPIVGPEAVTGSTRMKGGSMTKIVLDVIISHGCHKAGLQDNVSQPPLLLPSLAASPQALALFHGAVDKVYHSLRTPVFEQLLRFSGNALSRNVGNSAEPNGRVIYLTADPFLGFVGIIDASECPPTFGAAFEDVQCFVDGEWATLGIESNSPLMEPDVPRISIAAFLELGPSERDLIVVLSTSMSIMESKEKFSSILSSVPSKKALVVISSSSVELADPLYDTILQVVLGEELQNYSCIELAAKLVLNAISTCGHVQAGKVIGNKMVDVAVSNIKLYHRATRIIAECAVTSLECAEDALLRSIYDVDEVTVDILNTPIPVRISDSKKRRKVVPRAILLASGKASTVREGDAILQKEPILRRAMEA